MIPFVEWLVIEWKLWMIPIAVVVFSFIALFWLRRLAVNRTQNWLKKKNLPTEIGIFQALRWPSFIWCLIISINLGIAVSSESILPSAWKYPIGKGLWTLFILSLVLVLLRIIRELVTLYGPKVQLSRRGITITKNIAYAVVLTITVLVILGIWGVPTTPFVIFIAIVVLAAVLIFRDAAPNLFAGFQLNTSREFNEGDYIRLETGEEGQITRIGWDNTYLKSPDNSIRIIPNRKLLQTKLINYGHQYKTAKEPFRFSSRVLLTELTGLRAGNVQELRDILQNAPDAVIYYHTHHFLEQHFYLTPEPANDFAIWVNDSLGDEALGERLASVDAMAYSSLSDIRDRIVGVIDECLTQRPLNRQASEGDEFYFFKSVSVIFPTHYEANNLREFTEVLRKLSLGSLYFHMYESRLRLGHGQNDFSTWLLKSMDEPALAAEVTRIDPYTYTLEGLRLTLIRLIEKHLK